MEEEDLAFFDNLQGNHTVITFRILFFRSYAVLSTFSIKVIADRRISSIPNCKVRLVQVLLSGSKNSFYVSGGPR